jgi:hypothetical protein
MVEIYIPSVDQLRALLRFYLQWPGMPLDDDDEQEAEHFLGWMNNELGESEATELTGGLAGVLYFIHNNTHVLTRAKHLKSEKAPVTASVDVRHNERIPINTQMFGLVYDCSNEPDLEGKVMRGILLDIASNGMRIESNVPVPAGTILSITVAKFGAETALYNLTGEVRWLSEHAEAFHVGISIFSIEDHREWSSFFHALQRTWK